MNYYSWETHKEKKPWYFQAWFLALLVIFILGCFGALAGYGYLYYKFAPQIEGYDLSKLEKMESASLIYDRNGKQIGKIFIQNRLPINFSEIPKNMVQSIIAEEDNRFFEHNGVDYFGILRAAISNYRQGRIKQGASTVTQQLARNSFDLRERSIQRKIIEMFLAHRIERFFSKEKIMELYLNRVYFGSGFYGVEAASMGYFGKPAKNLTVSESAMLAGLLKSPNALSPWNNPKGALGVRDFVLTRMHEMGFINKKVLREALQQPLGVQKRSNPFKVSYAIDLVRQQAIAALGYERAMNGGVRIDTTFDSKLQQVAENSLHQELDHVEKTEGYDHETYADYRERNSKLEETVARGGFVTFPTPSYLQGAALAIDNQTGGILALVGGRDFMHNEYNRALQGRRPAGTVFTPFVAAAAYSKGIFPGEIVDDACMDNHYVMIGGETGILGEWGVERSDNSYEGSMTSHEAVARGKNAAVVRLGFLTGIESLKQFCTKAGIRAPLRDVSNAYLGTSEMELDELTLAYSTFPGKGTRPDRLYCITKITDVDGKVLFETPLKRAEVTSPEVAFQMHTLLDDALHKTNALEIKQDGLMPFSSGGKSGTAYDFTDAWFIGYSSAITCGVWLGYDKPQKIYRGAFGKDLALPVWSSIMNASLESFVPELITPPKGLQPVKICNTSGMLAIGSCGDIHTVVEYATESQKPKEECDVHGNGSMNYAKKLEKEEEAEWPKAVVAIDLTRVKPVAVSAPTLLASTDIYQSIMPVISIAEEDKNIPVAKAIALDGKALKTSSSATNNTTPAFNPEVRKAEAVRPLDLPSGAPVMNLPAPRAINIF